MEYTLAKLGFSSTLLRTILAVGFHDVQKHDSSFCLSPHPPMPEIRHKRIRSRNRGTSSPPIFKLKERVRNYLTGAVKECGDLACGEEDILSEKSGSHIPT
jgi:hypothetical protein